MIQFPNGFLWGAATSAYQVEGDNINADWWHWEKNIGLKEVSGSACKHYQYYGEDFLLAKSLNHNAHRLSIEWSRVEPVKGGFLEKEITHYKDVIASLRKNNLEPIITLHHFTNPVWFSELGGFRDKKAYAYFLSYVEEIVQALADKVTYWITINEPLVYVYNSYIAGRWPPQEKSLKNAKTVIENLCASHIAAYRLIHSIYKNRKLSAPLISTANSLQIFSACGPALRNKISVFLRDRLFNFSFIKKLLHYKTLDFIGVNYYTRQFVDVSNWRIYNLLSESCDKSHHQFKQNYLGWEIYPQGLYELLIRFKKYNLPILITENGICTDDDSQRWEFIRRHLGYIHLAIEKGVRVIGYIYWSLIDNFEWDKGVGPKFGLIEVDYTTFKRTIRESARKFSAVCNRSAL